MSQRRLVALAGFSLVVLVGSEAAAQRRFTAEDLFASPELAASVAAHGGPAALRPSRRAPAVPQRAAQSADDNRARTEFERGVNLAGQFQWSEAAEAFEASYRLSPRPNTLFNLGLAHRALGHYTRAIEELQQFLNESSGAADLQEQHNQAQQIVGEMQGELSSLTIAPSVPNATITLDDRPVQANEAIHTDPGNHIVVVSADGFNRNAQTVTLQRRETRQLDVRLERRGGVSPLAVVGLVGAGVVVAGAVVGGILLFSHEAPPDCGSLQVCIQPH